MMAVAATSHPPAAGSLFSTKARIPRRHNTKIRRFTCTMFRLFKVKLSESTTASASGHQPARLVGSTRAMMSRESLAATKISATLPT